MYSLENSTNFAESTETRCNMGDLTILDLPAEVQLKILALLDIQGLLAIRQTCRRICQVTHERLLWMSLLERQRQYLPVPYDLLNSEDPHLPNHPTSLLESIVRQTQRVADGWPRPRNAVSRKLQRKTPHLTLMGVEIFLDRWLVVAYSEGVVYLYDIQPTPTPTINPHDEKDHQADVVLRSALELKSGIWASYAVSVDVMTNKLFLALARSVPPFFIHIYEIDLTELSSNNDMAPDAFKLIRMTTSRSSPVIGAVHTKDRIVAVAVSSSNIVELVQWDEDPDENDRRLNIRLPADLEDPSKEIIATHFMGPYILIFKTKSIELHDFISVLRHGPSEPPTWPPLKHHFTMTFRDASFADCARSHDRNSETDAYTTTFFAYDVIQGLFQYAVQLTLPTEPSILPPSLQVTLMGIYPLVSTRYSGRIAALVPMQTRMTMTNSTASFSPSQEQEHSYLMRLASRQLQSNSNGNTRGFVYTHAMGSQGTRGIWIERKRSSPVREVQVWSKQPLTDDSDSMPTEIERRVVYSVNSSDLAEEIKYCTLSELTGKIVLGSRSGDITILDI